MQAAPPCQPPTPPSTCPPCANWRTATCCATWRPSPTSSLPIPPSSLTATAPWCASVAKTAPTPLICGSSAQTMPPWPSYPLKSPTATPPWCPAMPCVPSWTRPCSPGSKPRPQGMPPPCATSAWGWRTAPPPPPCAALGSWWPVGGMRKRPPCCRPISTPSAWRPGC